MVIKIFNPTGVADNFATPVETSAKRSRSDRSGPWFNAEDAEIRRDSLRNPNNLCVPLRISASSALRFGRHFCQGRLLQRSLKGLRQISRAIDAAPLGLEMFFGSLTQG